MRLPRFVIPVALITAVVTSCAPQPLLLSIPYQKSGLETIDSLLPAPTVSAKPASTDTVPLGEQRLGKSFAITLPRDWAIGYEHSNGDERDVAQYYTQASALGVGNLLVRRYDLDRSVTTDDALRITSDQVRRWGANATVTATLTNANGQIWGVTYQTTTPKEPKATSAGEVVPVSGSAFFLRKDKQLLVVDLQGDKDNYNDALAAAVARSFTLK